MVRKHKGIIQTGGGKGKLKKGYKYSGFKLKSGLPKIVKSMKKIQLGGASINCCQCGTKNCGTKEKLSLVNKKCKFCGYKFKGCPVCTSRIKEI